MAGKTRASSGGIDPYVLFPVMENFLPKVMLPTHKSVIGKLRYLTSGGSHNMTHSEAVREVGKLVWTKWVHDTCYCVSLSMIVKRLTGLWEIYRKAREDYQRGRLTSTSMDQYRDKLASVCESLFDVAASTAQQIAACKNNWGVDMGPNEHAYMADQRTARVMTCDRGVDHVWYAVIMQWQRQKQKEKDHRLAMERQFQGESLENIKKIVCEAGMAVTSTDTSMETPEKVDRKRQQPEEEAEVVTSKKRRLFVSEREDGESGDIMPLKFAHIRDSERKV